MRGTGPPFAADGARLLDEAPDMVRNRRSSVQILAWTASIALMAAAVIYLVLAFNLLGAPPERPEGSDFVDFTVARLAWDHDRLPLDVASSLLFALAFFVLAGLGMLLGRPSGEAEGSSSILSAAFGVAGVLGAGAQLMYVGAVQVATDPIICDCGYRAEEILGRLEAMNIAMNQQTWLTQGALLAGAVGFVLAAALGGSWGMGRTWTTISVATAVLLVVGVIVQVVGLGDVADLIVLGTVGVVIPAWAIGLARRWPETA